MREMRGRGEDQAYKGMEHTDRTGTTRKRGTFLLWGGGNGLERGYPLEAY